ncbi:hypothetical protein OCAR_6941 [Afipia carboxidovorans OM5]|nr:hypothetical protein OCAR_6941 [Afipia carboxidovorans OM5]
MCDLLPLPCGERVGVRGINVQIIGMEPPSPGAIARRRRASARFWRRPLPQGRGASSLVSSSD